ncbi:MAG: WD40/YVTN/BNR-like repeat-containing protein, partial [Bacteroidota bacterium]
MRIPSLFLFSAGSVVPLVLSLFGAAVVSAQQAKLRYLECGDGVLGLQFIRSGQTGSLLFHRTGEGVWVFDEQTLKIRPVAATQQNASGYQYSGFSVGPDGAVFDLQHGFYGNRALRIDTNDEARLIGPPGNSLMAYHGNGVLSCSSADTALVSTRILSVDGALTWFKGMGGVLFKQFGAAVQTTKNPVRYWISCPSMGNRSFATPISREPTSLCIHRKDSVLWISRSYNSDTLWYADIADTSKRHFDTVLKVIGTNSETAVDDVVLHSVLGQPALMFHRSGWYAAYLRGQWRVVDTIPRMMGAWSFIGNAEGSIRGDALWYRAKGKLYGVVLDTVTHERIMVDLPTGGEFFVMASSRTEAILRPMVNTIGIALKYSAKNGFEIINSQLADLDRLPLLPMLYGFTARDGSPLVVPYHDGLVSVPSSGMGVLRALAMRGESWLGPSRLGPRIQTRDGLRTPYVGADEVISPGTKARLFTRDGAFVRDISSTPATAAVRLADSTILLANNGRVTRLKPDGSSDTVDLAPVILEGLDTCGYVSSVVRNDDGSIIAFVNGLRRFNEDSSRNEPLRAGGIVVSSDNGRTWTRAAVPVESPYFLGSVRTTKGALVASVSTVVRTDKELPRDGQAPAEETSNHVFEDRRIIRSEDGGLTWTLAYSSPARVGFGLVGGDGVVKKDGRLLLMTIDGILQSTNTGVDWDFHDLAGVRPGTYPLSLFQHAHGQPVFYCTSTGLYQQEDLTSVDEGQAEPPAPQPMARTWSGHRAAWESRGLHAKCLMTTTGRSVEAVLPEAGVYLVDLAHAATVTRELIM